MNRLDLKKIYQRRFDIDIEFRKKMWHILCENFFQRYIPKDSIILDIGAGYCEFINNIVGKRKVALDLNPDLKRFANSDVEAILFDYKYMEKFKDSSFDVIFVSNFFEHLTKDSIIKTVQEAHRVLKKNGKILILQPNIRVCYKDYWNFFDHITPLDDRSLSELLEINGFKVIESRPRFLPYRAEGRLPKVLFLIKIYLKIPILHYFFGKQVFIYAKKIECT